MLPTIQNIVLEHPIERIFEFDAQQGKYHWISVRKSDYPLFMLNKCGECNSPVCVPLRTIQETIHRMYFDYEHFKQHQTHFEKPIKKRGLINSQRFTLLDAKDIHRNLNPYKN